MYFLALLDNSSLPTYKLFQVKNKWENIPMFLEVHDSTPIDGLHIAKLFMVWANNHPTILEKYVESEYADSIDDVDYKNISVGDWICIGMDTETTPLITDIVSKFISLYQYLYKENREEDYKSIEMEVFQKLL